MKTGDFDYFLNKDYKEDLVNLPNAASALRAIDMLRNPVREASDTNKQHSLNYILNLCKMSAAYNKLTNPWLKSIREKITTNNQLRFIIPIDPDKGLIMISYTDDEHTKFWQKRKNNQLIMKRTIVKLVNDTFNIKINEPLKVLTCFWKSGVAYWNSNINSVQISKFLTNPMPNIYICGENYSQTQSWVEGALQTCNQFLLTQQIMDSLVYYGALILQRFKMYLGVVCLCQMLLLLDFITYQSRNALAAFGRLTKSYSLYLKNNQNLLFSI